MKTNKNYITLISMLITVCMTLSGCVSGCSKKQETVDTNSSKIVELEESSKPAEPTAEESKIEVSEENTRASELMAKAIEYLTKNGISKAKLTEKLGKLGYTDEEIAKLIADLAVNFNIQALRKAVDLKDKAGLIGNEMVISELKDNGFEEKEVDFAVSNYNKADAKTMIDEDTARYEAMAGGSKVATAEKNESSAKTDETTGKANNADNNSKSAADNNSKTESEGKKDNSGSESSEQNATEQTEASAGKNEQPENNGGQQTEEPAEETQQVEEQPAAQVEEAPVQQEEQQTEQPAQETQQPAEQPAQQETQQPAHTHTWTEVKKTVHHDEIGHYETKTVTEAWDETVVVEEAWDEEVPVYEEKTYEVCECGAVFETVDECTAHQLSFNPFENYEEWEKHTSSGTIWETVQVGTETVHHEAVTKVVHHDAVTEEVWVVDQAAYDEEVIDYYKCSECGATK